MPMMARFFYGNFVFYYESPLKNREQGIILPTPVIIIPHFMLDVIINDEISIKMEI